jgi:hypothetical protein
VQLTGHCVDGQGGEVGKAGDVGLLIQVGQRLEEWTVAG